MDNLETQGSLGAGHRKTNMQSTKKMSNMDPAKNQQKTKR